MFKIIASTLAIAGFLAISQTAQAESRWMGSRDGHWRSGDEDTRPQGRRKSLKRDLYRIVRHDQLPLRRLFRLNDRYEGYRVESISVKLKGRGARGRARLLMNGRVVDSERLRGERVLRLSTARNAVVGHGLRSLKLEIDGRAFIKHIKVQLRRTKFAHRDHWEGDWRPHHDRWDDPTPRYRPTGLDKLDGARLIGGLLGAVAGSRFGKGSGKVAATIGGGLLGVLIGGEVGASMDRRDRARTQTTLENTRTGETTSWVNPDSGASYNVTPTRTYRTGNGEDCRDYTVWGFIDGYEQQVQGTACRNADGTWRTVSK